jgi:hypothetical protein
MPMQRPGLLHFSVNLLRPFMEFYININCVASDISEDVLNNMLYATISVYLSDCMCCRPPFFAVYLFHSPCKF